jgi:hypothetical protein
MKIAILLLCAVDAALFVFTWNPVCLIPLVAGLIAFGAHCLKTRMEATARQKDPDYDRKVKEWQFRIVPPLVGAGCLVIAASSFFKGGWGWSVLLWAAGGFYCFWFARWGVRHVRRQATPPSS